MVWKNHVDKEDYEILEHSYRAKFHGCFFLVCVFTRISTVIWPPVRWWDTSEDDGTPIHSVSVLALKCRLTLDEKWGKISTSRVRKVNFNTSVALRWSLCRLCFSADSLTGLPLSNQTGRQRNCICCGGGGKTRTVMYASIKGNYTHFTVNQDSLANTCQRASFHPKDRNYRPNAAGSLCVSELQLGLNASSFCQQS